MKAIEFNSIKNPATIFFVTSVLKEDNFEELKEIEQKLKNNGVNFKFNIFKKNERYINYDDEISRYIYDKGYEAVEKTCKNLFGSFCRTGVLFFIIYVNGNVSRCYNLQPYYYLGNIAKGTFKRLKEVKPCFAQSCNCTVPVDRNMICFGHKANKLAIISAYIQGCFWNLSFLLPKIYDKLLNLERN